jgi:tryptophan-rich hypothetical protein
MNNINPKKLLNTKWTAQAPKNKEKHFIITEVEYNEIGEVVLCELQSVFSKRQQYIDWRELKDIKIWKQGWISQASHIQQD